MNELTNYKEFHDLLRVGKTPQDLGFINKISSGDIIRFASRYKVAKSFQGVILDGFSDKTTEGYTGLFRLFLSWSTFEQFLEMRGVKQKNTAEFFDKYNAIAIYDEIKNNGRSLYLFILSKVDKYHKPEIEKLFANQPLNSSYLASGIRHLFAHGLLSPHANGSQPKHVVRICNLISDFLLNIIDLEFSQQISCYLNYLENSNQETIAYKQEHGNTKTEGIPTTFTI